MAFEICLLALLSCKQLCENSTSLQSQSICFPDSQHASCTKHCLVFSNRNLNRIWKCFFSLPSSSCFVVLQQLFPGWRALTMPIMKAVSLTNTGTESLLSRQTYWLPSFWISVKWFADITAQEAQSGSLCQEHDLTHYHLVDIWQTAHSIFPCTMPHNKYYALPFYSIYVYSYHTIIL